MDPRGEKAEEDLHFPVRRVEKFNSKLWPYKTMLLRLLSRFLFIFFSIYTKSGECEGVSGRWLLSPSEEEEEEMVLPLSTLA